MAKEKITRILVFSDLQSHPWQEAQRPERATLGAQVIEKVFAHAASTHYDAIIFAGDLFEAKRSLRVDVLASTYAACAKLTTVCPEVFFMAGNHDYYREECSLTPLRNMGIEVIDRSTRLGLLGVVVEGRRVLFVPNGINYSGVAALHPVFDLCVLHDTLAGARISKGRVEESTVVPTSLLQPAKGRYLVVSGHYHTPQVVRMPGCLPVHVVGAPVSHSWSDADETVTRGFMSITFTGEGKATKRTIKRFSLDDHFPKFYTALTDNVRADDFVKHNISVPEAPSVTSTDATALSVASTNRVRALGAYVAAQYPKGWAKRNRDEYVDIVKRGLAYLDTREDE